jgi:uncharacterized membrane protein
MLTAFFTFFGIGAGIAVLLVMAAILFAVVWFLWKALSPTPGEARQAWRDALDKEKARFAAKEQQRD